jgi:hypothetical protein
MTDDIQQLVPIQGVSGARLTLAELIETTIPTLNPRSTGSVITSARTTAAPTAGWRATMATSRSMRSTRAS